MAASAAPNLDLSLDDMMANRPRNKGGRRGGRRNGGGGARRNGNDGTIVLGGGGVARPINNRENRRNRPYAAGPSTIIPASLDGGSKIIVSNLDFNVTEEDLKELFATQVGPLRKVTLSFDQNGRSRGIAQVTFARKADGATAYERYHNVTLDGRPMKIEIVVAPVQSTIGRLVLGTPNQSPNQRQGGGRIQSGGRGGRTGRGGRSDGGRGNKNAPKKTAEDLDAEMSAYMNSENGTAMDEDIVM